MNFVLVGFMGAGKTTVGRLLAKKLNVEFRDTDELIEQKTGKTIAMLFEEFGEDKFREIENSVIQKLQPSGVLATGGGSIVNNFNELKSLGKIVYLKTDIEDIHKRISLKNRPLANKANELFEARKSLYEKADIIISTTNKNPEHVVIEIIALGADGESGISTGL